MVVGFAHIAEGVGAVTSLVALIWAVCSKSADRRRWALRVVQVSMTLAGLMVMATTLLGEGWDQAVYGLMLIVFGTGVTAFGPTRTKNGDQA